MPSKDTVVEEITHGDFFVTLHVLVPIAADIRNILLNAVDACNFFGNFLSTDIIVTNVKDFSNEEISEMINPKSSSILKNKN